MKVRAFDGAYEDYCTVKIKISNVNDNPPVFQYYNNNITIEEEKLLPGCITKVRNKEFYILIYLKTNVV